MSGTIPLSMTQQMDQYGDPLSGGKLYFIQAGTVSTPQNAFQDSALTLPWPNPITLDAAGRIPQLFIADGLIKIRLTDIAGVTQLVADNVQVVGPSGGGGGGGTVDPTTIYQTGDLKSRYGTGAHTGWVRANNLTIGSATSGGTERANADCQALFVYLWGVDSSLTVSGGRGASGLADWTSNKQLTLPDWRGYNISALDDMGNSPANRLGTVFPNATTLGATGGLTTQTILTSQLPPYTPSGTVTNGTLTVSGLSNVPTSTLFTGNNSGGGGGAFGIVNGGPAVITVSQSASSFTGSAQGGANQALATISPRKLCTIYLKL